ncbi:MAG: bifunctional diguanylate cyclase/phosphodiesterase [Proteobacteria bacterium]|nr:bifunctional diguanylate cyclase/phosphodiesterase [Pseudomonadota bacterium]MBU1686122.1 bifunctional diguanylate cyclase/phosphodiesterase [Pseudomonadota bacterium]
MKTDQVIPGIKQKLPSASGAKQRLKIYSTIIMALVIGGLFFSMNFLAQQQTVGRLTLSGMLGEIEKLEMELQSEVLHNSFFLYHDYDRIHQLTQSLEKKLVEIQAFHQTVFSGSHPIWNGMVARYSNTLAQQKEWILRFLTANSTIKNSSMYIPALSHKYIEITDHIDPLFLDRISSVASSVYLAKNGLDQNLVDELGDAVKELKQFIPETPEAALIQQSFVGHLQVFINYFPDYRDSMTALLSPSPSDLLAKLRSHIASEDNEWLERLRFMSLVFLSAFLASIGMIIFLLIKTGRENLILLQLQQALTKAATTDRLTNLANRFAFDGDIKEFEHPLLFLINIDEFKHINDLYGVQAGDYILSTLANQLGATVPMEMPNRLYRLGGDDFGILLEDQAGFNRDLFAQTLLETIENQCIYYQRQSITISVAIGVSDRQPLLETADMALNHVKLKKRNLKYQHYSEALNIPQTIAHNFQILNSIRHALENDGVLAAFQPIVDNRTGAIAKYECLIRLRSKDGTILAPQAFLDIAKESALYPELTKAIIHKSFQAFRENSLELSINLSVTDILDHQVHEFIIDQLENNPNLAQRLTFEILESEGVENYEVVHNFIRQIKVYGCHFAADDFGAGYSNFSHILRLKIDILKIDASLIKQLDTDENARILVGNIADFCRKLKIKTVAEYVHSKEVLQVVRDLGIDFSQGYFLGETCFDLPEPPIIFGES